MNDSINKLSKLLDSVKNKLSGSEKNKQNNDSNNPSNSQTKNTKEVKKSYASQVAAKSIGPRRTSLTSGTKTVSL